MPRYYSKEENANYLKDMNRAERRFNGANVILIKLVGWLWALGSGFALVSCIVYLIAQNVSSFQSGNTNLELLGVIAFLTIIVALGVLFIIKANEFISSNNRLDDST